MVVVLVPELQVQVPHVELVVEEELLQVLVQLEQLIEVVAVVVQDIVLVRLPDQAQMVDQE